MPTKPTPIQGTVTEVTKERFWDKVEQRGSCMVWTGAKNRTKSQVNHKPYGVFRFNPEEKDIPARNVYVHRFAVYMVTHEDPGETVDHLCYNTLCVNIQHLLPDVSFGDNLRRQISAQAEFCAHGHRYTEENTYVDPNTGRRSCRECRRASWRKSSKGKYEREKAQQTHTSSTANGKLDWDKVAEIRRLYATGEWSQRKLAREFTVSQPMVGLIVREEAWKEEVNER